MGEVGKGERDREKEEEGGEKDGEDEGGVKKGRGKGGVEVNIFLEGGILICTGIS